MKKTNKRATQQPTSRLTLWLELSQYIVLAVLLFFVVLFSIQISNLQAQVDVLETEVSR